MKNDVASFTAADSIPIKLLQNMTVLKNLKETGLIPPVHIQFIPTNVCNISCSFCSCAKEDRNLEMSYDQLRSAIRVMAPWMTTSVTITGGGEPLMYPLFDVMVDLFRVKHIKIGLVTNGILLHQQSKLTLNKLTWCRISQGDSREPMDDKYVNNIIQVVRQNSMVDWAFSYVVSSNPDVNRISNMIVLAEDLGMTHVRLVADLLEPDNVPMEALADVLEPLISVVRVPVIFQDRKKPERGSDCRICYLKPVFAPDMKVYACCGVQYAFEEPSKKLPSELCLGSIENFPEIVKKMKNEPFEGAKHCVKCYYGEYNRFLSMMVTALSHPDFV